MGIAVPGGFMFESDPAVSAKKKEYEKDMQDLLAKDVAELASGLDMPKVTEVKIRGRVVALRPDNGVRGMISMLFACLYSLEDPRVDAILEKLKIGTTFSKDGGLVVESFITDAEKTEKAPQAAPSKGRNIIFEAPPKLAPQILAVTIDGKLAHLAVPVEIDEADGSIVVEAMGGIQFNVKPSEVRPVTSYAELVELASKLAAK